MSAEQSTTVEVIKPILKEGQFTVGNDPTVHELSDETKAAIADDPGMATQLIAGEMFGRIADSLKTLREAS